MAAVPLVHLTNGRGDAIYREALNAHHVGVRIGARQITTGRVADIDVITRIGITGVADHVAREVDAHPGVVNGGGELHGVAVGNTDRVAHDAQKLQFVYRIGVGIIDFIIGQDPSGRSGTVFQDLPILGRRRRGYGGVLDANHSGTWIGACQIAPGGIADVDVITRIGIAGVDNFAVDQADPVSGAVHAHSQAIGDQQRVVIAAKAEIL